MIPYEQVLQICTTLHALEAMRRELESRCSPFRAEGEEEGSAPVAETEDTDARTAAAALFDNSLAEMELIPLCCQVRLALMRAAEQLGVQV